MHMFKDNPLAVKLKEMIVRSNRMGGYSDHSGKILKAPCISFRDYMAACLYDEQYGYYRSGPIRVGKEGDFYTSSAVGDVMAEVIARYSLDFANRIGYQLAFGEWGAGTGKLSAAIFSAICRMSDQKELFFTPFLIEDHPAHAASINNSFLEAGLDLSPTVFCSDQIWSGAAAKWMEQPMLLLANELLDAFPVHRVRRRGEKLLELGVSMDSEGAFFYVELPVTNPSIPEWLERDGIALLDGQATEVCPDARAWLIRLGKIMKRGRVVLIDYGHDAEEYAAEHRMEGTLMTYWRHQGADTPFETPGERDITAHVSFSFIRSSAVEAGFSIVYYGTQKQFLMDYGAMELLVDHDGSDPFSAAARRNRAVRQLLLSDGMSESFKVMILEKV